MATLILADKPIPAGDRTGLWLLCNKADWNQPLGVLMEDVAMNQNYRTPRRLRPRLVDNGYEMVPFSAPPWELVVKELRRGGEGLRYIWDYTSYQLGIGTGFQLLWHLAALI